MTYNYFIDYEKKIKYIKNIISNLNIVTFILSTSQFTYLNQDVTIENNIKTLIKTIVNYIKEMGKYKLIIWNNNLNILYFIVPYYSDYNIESYLIDSSINLDNFLSDKINTFTITELNNQLNEIINYFNNNIQICNKYLLYNNIS